MLLIASATAIHTPTPARRMNSGKAVCSIQRN